MQWGVSRRTRSNDRSKIEGQHSQSISKEIIEYAEPNDTTTATNTATTEKKRKMSQRDRGSKNKDWCAAIETKVQENATRAARIQFNLRMESWQIRIVASVEPRMNRLREQWRRGGGSDMGDNQNELVREINLRRFVTDSVFGKYKLINKRETLERVVEAAITFFTNKYITKPDGWELADMRSKYTPVVRSCLDGCCANAQTVARRKYLRKWCKAGGIIIASL